VSIIVIVVILGVITFGHPGNFFNKSNFDGGIGNTIKKWVSGNVWSGVSGEVDKLKVPAQQEIVKQKNNFFQNMWGDLENYLAGKFSKISGTNVTGQTCPQP